MRVLKLIPHIAGRAAGVRIRLARRLDGLGQAGAVVVDLEALEHLLERGRQPVVQLVAGGEHGVAAGGRDGRHAQRRVVGRVRLEARVDVPLVGRRLPRHALLERPVRRLLHLGVQLGAVRVVAARQRHRVLPQIALGGFAREQAQAAGQLLLQLWVHVRLSSERYNASLTNCVSVCQPPSITMQWWV